MPIMNTVLAVTVKCNLKPLIENKLVYTTFFVCVAVVFHSHAVYVEGKETYWNATVLSDPNRNGYNYTESAVSIAQLSSNTFIVAMDRVSSSSQISTPIIYKVTSSGFILWTLPSATAKGSPFDIVIHSKSDTAFLLVGCPANNSVEAKTHVIRFSNISRNPNLKNIQSVIHETAIYSTPSNKGTTKLFALVLHPTNGDLYLTGGSTESFYGGRAKGKSDVIVLRLSSLGKILSTAQFGSEQSEFGRAIDISSDSSTILIAGHQDLKGGGSQSCLFRLNATSLKILEGPKVIDTFGALPLFTATSISTSGPTINHPNTTTTFIGGHGLVIPHQNMDMFVHVYAKYGHKESNIGVYIDGAKSKKGNDYCVSIKTGRDGNAYCVGYTVRHISPSISLHRLNLVVISPTGKRLYVNQRESPQYGGLLEKPSAACILTKESNPIIVYVGNRRNGSVNLPTLGFIVPFSDVIPRFEGFKRTAAVSGAVSIPIQSFKGQKHGRIPLALMFSIIGGALLGSLLIISGVLGFKKWNQTRDSPTAREEKRNRTEESLSALPSIIAPGLPPEGTNGTSYFENSVLA